MITFAHYLSPFIAFVRKNDWKRKRKEYEN
jgi:hypothetical protein